MAELIALFAFVTFDYPVAFWGLVTACVLWVTAGIPLAGYAFAHSALGQSVGRKLRCLCHHRHYDVSRVPVGFADWVEVRACAECGDRWCRRT